MSKILGNIEPWIASVVFDALTFDCPQDDSGIGNDPSARGETLAPPAPPPPPIKKQDRQTKLVQVLQPPQAMQQQQQPHVQLHPRSVQSTLYHLLVSDGMHCISVYVKLGMSSGTEGNDMNSTPCRSSTLLMNRIKKGSLIRLCCHHWTVSLSSLMKTTVALGSSNDICSDHDSNGDHDHNNIMAISDSNDIMAISDSNSHHRGRNRDSFCLIVFEEALQWNPHRVLLDDSSDIMARGKRTQRPCIECLGCEGMGIVGVPVDVHVDLDIRRALLAIPSRLQRWNQIVNGFNDGLLWGNGKSKKESEMDQVFPRRWIPCPDLIAVASFDFYPSNVETIEVLEDIEEDVHEWLEKKGKNMGHDETCTWLEQKRQREVQEQADDEQDVDGDELYMDQYLSMGSVASDGLLGTQMEMSQRMSLSAMLEDGSSQEEEEVDVEGVVNGNGEKYSGNHLPSHLETYDKTVALTLDARNENHDYEGGDNDDDDDDESPLETQQPHASPCVTMNGNDQAVATEDERQDSQLDTQPMVSRHMVEHDVRNSERTCSSREQSEVPTTRLDAVTAVATDSSKPRGRSYSIKDLIRKKSTSWIQKTSRYKKSSRRQLDCDYITAWKNR